MEKTDQENGPTTSNLQMVLPSMGIHKLEGREHACYSYSLQWYSSGNMGLPG